MLTSSISPPPEGAGGGLWELTKSFIEQKQKQLEKSGQLGSDPQIVLRRMCVFSSALRIFLAQKGERKFRKNAVISFPNNCSGPQDLQWFFTNNRNSADQRIIPI